MLSIICSVVCKRYMGLLLVCHSLAVPTSVVILISKDLPYISFLGYMIFKKKLFIYLFLQDGRLHGSSAMTRKLLQ